MTHKIRVALQGGGAKLVTLIAAADVLKELADDGEIEITQVAGTSAGAIVACMLATKQPMDNYRLQALNAAKKVITHFSNKPWKIKIAWKLYYGKPIFLETKAQEFMRELFGEERLSNLKIPTKIVASSVRNKEKHVFDSAVSDQKIVDVVTTSCALPLAFRSYHQKDSYVDGGLVSNFPASELIKDNPNQDSLLGFSFAYKQENDPNSLAEYLSTLASTAIESNVENNAERMKEVGGRVCKLPNQFSTLDFQKAIEALEDVPYEEMKKSVRTEVIKTLALLEQQSKTTKRAAGESLDTKMLRIYAAITKEYPIKTVRASMLIIANCLKVKVDTTTSEPDEIIQTVDFQPISQSNKILAVRLGLAAGGSAPLSNEKNDIRVTDSDGNEIETTSMIVEEDGQFFSILILDQPITLTGSSCLRVVYRTIHKDLMANLNKYQRIAVRSYCRQNDVKKAQDILIAVPNELGLVVLNDLYDQIPLLQNEGLSYTQEDIGQNWKNGRLMSQQELIKAHGGLSPSGFSMVGWRTENLQPDYYYGVLVQINK